MTYHIRRATPDDSTAVQAIFTCQSVIRQSLQLPFPSLSRWQQCLSEMNDLEHHLVCCDAQQQPVAIGSISRAANLRRLHSASLSLVVHEAHQGRGVGKQLLHALIDYADNWLGLIRLELCVYADNERAITLYQRCGFEIECQLRNDTFRDGKYEDGLLMARLRWPQGDAA